MNRISFLSGLPRSGSTLLVNLLNQNPLLYASNESKYLFDVLQGNSGEHYDHITKPYVIDNNRAWGNNESLSLLTSLPNAKVIVTIRPILEILASFIQLAESNPDNYIDRFMKEENFQALHYRPINDARCDWLMAPQNQLDNNFLAVHNLLKYPQMVHVINYSTLTTEPQKTLNDLYKFFELEPYSHNFNKIETLERVDDKTLYGIPTMHEVRPQLDKSKTNYEAVLSDYVITKYSNALNFMQDWL
jgi:sulfotransferase